IWPKDICWPATFCCARGSPRMRCLCLKSICGSGPKGNRLRGHGKAGRRLNEGFERRNKSLGKSSYLDRRKGRLRNLRSMKIHTRHNDSHLGGGTYCEWRPARLAGLVEVVWYFKGPTSSVRKRILPNGTVELLVNFGEPYRTI